MRSISREDIKRRDAIFEKLFNLHQNIVEQTQVVNAHIAALNYIIENYNEVVSQDVAGFVEDMTSEMFQYMSERSENWQESEAGVSYQEWIEHWGGAYFEIIPPVDEIEIPEETNGDVLRDLRKSPSG